MGYRKKTIKADVVKHSTVIKTTNTLYYGANISPIMLTIKYLNSLWSKTPDWPFKVLR